MVKLILGLAEKMKKENLHLDPIKEKSIDMAVKIFGIICKPYPINVSTSIRTDIIETAEQIEIFLRSQSKVV